MLAPQPTFHIKVAVTVLATIGIATFVFGAIRIFNGINSPFAKKAGYAFKTLDAAQKERDDKLKTDDTDQDGLTDYDELYVFRTSPFLADTDSDGINDGVEVNSNQNPNCPQGKTCLVEHTATTDTTATAVKPTTYDTTTPASAPASTATDEQILAAITKAFGDPTKLTPDAMAAKIQTLPLADLKNFLLAIGIPQNLLDKADESSLRLLVKQTLIDSTTNTAPATPSTATPTK